MIYLATPYSHADQAVMTKRFHAACHAAAVIMGQGEVVFCPIAHSHPISLYMGGDAQTDFDLWMAQDLPHLERADELIIVMMEGWDTSNGIKKEREFAAEHHIIISYMDPITLERVEYTG